MDKEQYYDKLLNIKTDQNMYNLSSSINYYPYEPTPYSALEELFQHYEVKKSDRIVDFGSGKGRLNFYINHFFKATVIGVEMNETLFQAAQENYNSYVKKHRTRKGSIQFYKGFAENYAVHHSDTHFYFFNPFSIQIFKRTISNVLFSFEQAPRQMELLLYYPSEEYIDFLGNQTQFELNEEIVLKDLFKKDISERFLIYQLSY